MFNYKKFVFKKFAEDKPTQSQPGKILNELDPNKSTGKILNELDTNKPVDKKVEEQNDPVAQAAARKLTEFKRKFDMESDTYTSAAEALGEVKKSPFAKVIPGDLTDPCKTIGDALNEENVFSPEDIQSIYQSYISSFQRKLSAFEAMFTAWEEIPNKEKVFKALDKTEQGLFADVSLNKILQTLNFEKVKITKEQKQFMQFDILYQDMFNYYSLLSRICETKTRYDAQVEQFKFGSSEDYQALLSYYEYGMSLLRVMAPKAASILPVNAKNIQSQYSVLIEKARAEISKLSIAPLKALYGRK